MRKSRLKLSNFSNFRRVAYGEVLSPLMHLAEQCLVLVSIEDAVELAEQGGPGVLFLHEEAADDDGR